jgi:hypothetical protein
VPGSLPPALASDPHRLANAVAKQVRHIVVHRASNHSPNRPLARYGRQKQAKPTAASGSGYRASIAATSGALSAIQSARSVSIADTPYQPLGIVGATRTGGAPEHPSRSGGRLTRPVPQRRPALRQPARISYPRSGCPSWARPRHRTRTGHRGRADMGTSHGVRPASTPNGAPLAQPKGARDGLTEDRESALDIRMGSVDDDDLDAQGLVAVLNLVDNDVAGA